jgi:glycosyltransferase involved in cell wall biosynthesis
MQLTFSIITIVKNNPTGLKRTIKSLSKQSYTNFELIVIDGKSSNETLEVIKDNKKIVNIWVTKKDRGIYHAMNKGIRMASGKIIGILNAGDRYYPNALKIINKYQKKYKNTDLFFGSVKKNRIMSGFHPNLINWKFNIFPGHSSGFFVRRKIHKKFGLYDENFRYSSDYDFIYRMIVKNKLKGISTKKNELIGNFDQHGISSQLSFFKTLHEEMKVRYKNNQNIIFILFLSIIKIVNKIKNLIIPKNILTKY